MRGYSIYDVVSTVAGAGITIATSAGTLFGGFFLNGSAGASTITIKDSATTILSTSAAADALIIVNLATPVHCSQIVATCSGTGFYSVFVAK